MVWPESGGVFLELIWVSLRALQRQRCPGCVQMVVLSFPSSWLIQRIIGLRRQGTHCNRDSVRPQILLSCGQGGRGDTMVGCAEGDNGCSEHRRQSDDLLTPLSSITELLPPN